MRPSDVMCPKSVWWVRVEVMQYGAGGYHRLGYMGHAEALESVGAELGGEPLLGGVGGEHPVIEVKHGAAVGYVVVGPLAHTRHAQQLFWAYVADEFVYVSGGALGAEELAGRYVEKGHADLCLVDMDGGKEVVLAGRQGVVVEVDARGDELGDAALHEFFGEFRVLELLAYGHSLAGAHQSRQIGVERVVGESGQLDVGRLAVGAARQGDAEDLAGGYGVVRECLVEVTDAEQQYRVGMFLLHLIVLGHQRCLGHVLR